MNGFEHQHRKSIIHAVAECIKIKSFTKIDPAIVYMIKMHTLRWRHNGCDSVSNHQPRDCLLSRLFIHRSKKTWKLRVTGLCVGNSPGQVNSPHKGSVTRKMFPFDDVIMSENKYSPSSSIVAAKCWSCPLTVRCHHYHLSPWRRHQRTPHKSGWQPMAWLKDKMTRYKIR